MVFDLLHIDGFSTMAQAYDERRGILEALELPPVAQVVSRFEDGEALFDAVETMGLEGVVAKRLEEPNRPGERGWVKRKNPAYWRLPLEREAVQNRRQQFI
jgi:bifunctional non-homologous end joining protein LigD